MNEIILTKDQVNETYSNICEDAWEKILTMIGIEENPDQVSVVRVNESNVKDYHYS